MNIAVFVSGKGTNLQAIIDQVKIGRTRARIALVFSDNEKAYALIRAKKAGIKTLTLDPGLYQSRNDFDKEIVKNLKINGVKLIVLAGYMRLLSPYLIKEYRNKILNVHPSLLPAFKGRNGIKDALSYGVKVTGATVHVVSEKIDSGPIICQSAVIVKDNDTELSLRKKIHKEEYKIYTKAINDFIEGRLILKGRKVLNK